MPRLEISRDSVSVTLSPLERIAALSRGVRVPRANVRSVTAVADAAAAVRGFRAPGLDVPRGVKIGTWRRPGGKEFVAVRRGRPGLVLTLEGGPYARVVVSVDDPDAVVRELTG